MWLLHSAPTWAQSDREKLADALKQGSNLLQKFQAATADMPEPQEIETGTGIAARFLGAVPLHSNAALQRYVNRVGRWVAMQSARPSLPWSFAVLDTPSVNAFAMPGGTIFVSVGLLQILKSESALAGVLGHEIAHVMQRHHVKAIQAAAGQDLFGQGALELVNRSQDASAAVKALLRIAVSTGIQLYSKGLDRGDEYEADRLGSLLAAAAGYDPYGLAEVLQDLSQLSRDQFGASIMLSTHPSPSERLVALESHSRLFEQFANQPTIADRWLQALRIIPNGVGPALQPPPQLSTLNPRPAAIGADGQPTLRDSPVTTQAPARVLPADSTMPKPPTSQSDSRERRVDKPAEAPRDVSIPQVVCQKLVQSGRKALELKSYDQEMAQARDALAELANCEGAQELLNDARNAKDAARRTLEIN
jgi:Zn-dependent protease with chaperone function